MTASMAIEEQEQITILVHGTFANPGFAEADANGLPDAEHPMWWRQTEQGLGESTADSLRDALEELDPRAAASLWRPGDDPRDGDLTYRDLGEWSGANTHKARVGAGRDLAASLDRLAEGRGCTSDNPLRVNFVAHSHGGNVVLEVFKHITDRVKPRQVCMLGTPLTWRFTDPRIAVYAYIIFLVVVANIGFAQGFLEDDDGNVAAGSIGEVVGLIIALLLFMPVILWTAVAVATFARWLSMLSGGKPAYGPKPDVLETTLDGRPAVLFISTEDEADLMLQLGAAPLDAYKALARGRPTLDGVETFLGRALCRVLRLVEFAYIRPFSYVVAIPLAEMVLEHFGLGFPVRSVVVRNYEMVTWTDAKTYEETQIVTRPVGSDELKPRVLHTDLTHRRIAGAAKMRRRPSTETDDERIEALRETLLGTVKGLREQVNLRHSGYYESQKIIEEVAQAIAGPAAEVRGEAIESGGSTSMSE